MVYNEEYNIRIYQIGYILNSVNFNFTTDLKKLRRKKHLK